jgi:hypothetical protein
MVELMDQASEPARIDAMAHQPSYMMTAPSTTMLFCCLLLSLPSFSQISTSSIGSTLKARV